MKNLGICPKLVKTLEERSITKPTAVQNAVIPVIAAGKHCLFESETGTGKTLAYLLPLLQKLLLNDNSEMTAEGNTKDTTEKKSEPVTIIKFATPQVLIIAPTLELASQIKTEINTLSNAKALLCFGGAPIKRQVEALKEKPFAVVGSPLRILELIHLKKLKIGAIKAIILDEVDRLLSPEMRDDTMRLVDIMPKSAQLIACTATLPKSLQKLLLAKAENFTNTESQVLMLPQEDVLKRRISHWAFYAQRRDKTDVLRRFLAAENPTRAIVFCARTDEVATLAERLRYHKVDCVALTARTDKIKRKQAIDRFRSGKCPIIITSDLAARGLDIPDISHIIQLDVPGDADFFVHRAGRTARAGKTGINAVIGDEREMRDLARLEKKLGIIVYPKELRNGKVINADADDSQ